MPQTPDQRETKYGALQCSAIAKERYADERPGSYASGLEHGYEHALFEHAAPLEAEVQKLRDFIDKFIPSECWGIDAFDGGEIQDAAEAMGVLVKVEHPQPCEAEECNCEGSDFLYYTSWTVPTNTDDK